MKSNDSKKKKVSRIVFFFTLHYTYMDIFRYVVIVVFRVVDPSRE